MKYIDGLTDNIVLTTTDKIRRWFQGALEKKSQL